MADAKQYLDKAAECEAAARKSPFQKDRASLLEIAQQYRTLAAHADRGAPDGVMGRRGGLLDDD